MTVVQSALCSLVMAGLVASVRLGQAKQRRLLLLPPSHRNTAGADADGGG